VQVVGEAEHVLHGVWQETQILLEEGAKGDGHIPTHWFW